MTELPPPTPALAQGPDRPYLIGPFDKVEVDVFGVPELSRREIQTDAGGRISFPLAGTIEANGLTAERLAAEIGNRLRGRYVRNPQVTVNITESVSRVVTVDGEVREPGRYPVVGRMTLMRAIASARGLSEFARQNEVVVFREVGDQQMAALYNLAAIRNGQYRDPEIFAGDIVMVGDSPGRRLFRDILQAAPLITTPIIALIQSTAP
ncbi:MAG TPA: polysaccharide biosynthesis/export family protein [Allosphingosinicella sp.]|nr:polysaccharide biosynthesis/export family protein [Allosphingosinicella sp.]